MGSGGNSDTLAYSWDPFLPAGLLCPASMRVMCLVLLWLVMLCSVDNPGRPALLWGEGKEQWIWGRAEVGERREERREGNLWSGCDWWENKEGTLKSRQESPSLSSVREGLPGFNYLCHKILIIHSSFLLFSTIFSQWLSSSGKYKKQYYFIGYYKCLIIYSSLINPIHCKRNTFQKLQSCSTAPGAWFLDAEVLAIPNCVFCHS